MAPKTVLTDKSIKGRDLSGSQAAWYVPAHLWDLPVGSPGI